jgi:predicted MFS family arabinose efflux permease
VRCSRRRRRPGWPGVFIYAVVRAFPHAPAAATGVTQTGAFLGSATGPMLFGLVAARGSYDAAWLLSAGLAVAGAAAMLVSRAALRPGPGRRPGVRR